MQFCKIRFSAAAALLALCGALCTLSPASAQEAGQVWKVASRPGVSTAVFWAPAAGATATVLLFPGGEGGFGKMVQGWPTSDNYLVRTAPEFVKQGLNVAIVGRANGQPLQPVDRMGADHMQDIRSVLQAVQARSIVPVWLVGTSRGTTSVASVASQMPNGGFAGVVLTSSIVAPGEAGTLPSLDLAAVKVPVLLIQHGQDACHLCTPSAMPAVLERFTQAPIKQLRVVDGGGPPSGGTCHARHWHGFVGMESAVVLQIAQWIHQPQP